VRDVLMRLLSREWAGLVIASVFLVLGLSLLYAFNAPLIVVALLLLAGVVLATGAISHLLKFSRVRRLHTAPGVMVDIGGYRLHLLAEGTAQTGHPAIVWFAGGHAPGTAIHHLHRTIRTQARSILIDRPGTGWSDTGPFPRTTAREADEVVLALQRSGAAGPFIFAGHSFGGLLCANIARRYPSLVHTLVLLDPTPLETIIFGPRFNAIHEMRRDAWWGGVLQLFGIDLAARTRKRHQSNPAYAALMHKIEAVLGPEVLAVRGLEARAGNYFAQASIYRELSPEGAASCAWETAVYDGDLGDMRVLLVAPKNDIDVTTLQETHTSDTTDERRAIRVLAATRERYLASSTNSQRIVTPAGTGHNFIYEAPDFVIELIRNTLNARG
jgi:pimeloyl-ACP methyl ester carboxylesterase